MFFTDSSVELTSRADGLDVFRTSIGGAFICQSETVVKLNHDVTLETYGLHIQAFKSGNGTKFVGSGKLLHPLRSYHASVL